MLSTKTIPIRSSILIGLLGLLTSCSGNTSLEEWLAANPLLKERNQKQEETAQNPDPEAVDPQNDVSTGVPNYFPDEIPIYPGSQLLEVKQESTAAAGDSRWSSKDPSDRIESYYQKELQANNWQIVRPLAQQPEDGKKTIVAQQNDLQVTFSIPTPSANNTVQGTQFSIAYQNLKNAENTPSPTEQPNNQTSTAPSTTTSFSDLDSAPQQLRQYLQDLAALGILSPDRSNPQAKEDQFAPNKNITRREYVRWLVSANNQIYASRPGQHIRLASNTSQPAFDDVPKTDPDFAAIQGLAEAGLISSRLSDDASAAQFRPGAPLTREDMIMWKVPLDHRQGLPPATIEAIKQSWGFQDAGKIDPKAFKALYTDYQNTQESNVRRVFGYTKLFQPKKPVTRAEAAASLWYFGYQGEGVSAREASQTTSTQSTNNNPEAPAN